MWTSLGCVQWFLRYMDGLWALLVSRLDCMCTLHGYMHDCMHGYMQAASLHFLLDCMCASSHSTYRFFAAWTPCWLHV